MIGIILLIYYLVGWIHAGMHAGFPTEKPLLISLFLWPVYYFKGFE